MSKLENCDGWCKTINFIAYLLVIIGAINWGLVGILDFNLVTFLFKDLYLAKIITYVAIGASGFWVLYDISWK